MSINNEFFTQLGILVVNFENFQKNLEFFIWALIDDDQIKGQIITSQLSFRNICDLACNLVQHICNDSELMENFESLINKACKFEEKRNSIVHSAYAWNPNNPDSTIHRIKIVARKGKGLKQQIEEINSHDLETINHEFGNLLPELWNFEDRIAKLGIIEINERQLITPMN